MISLSDISGDDNLPVTTISRNAYRWRGLRRRHGVGHTSSASWGVPTLGEKKFDQKAYLKAYREAHREELREMDRAYYEANKDQCKERSLERYRRNREAATARMKGYAAAHQEQMRANRKRYYRDVLRDQVFAERRTPEGRASHLLRTSRSGARKRGLAFELDLSHVLGPISAGRCQATGIAFDLDSSRGPWRPSIDRKDNTIGYTPDNVQIVVYIYNVAKSHYTPADVLLLAKAIVARDRAARRSAQ